MASLSANIFIGYFEEMCFSHFYHSMRYMGKKKKEKEKTAL